MKQIPAQLLTVLTAFFTAAEAATLPRDKATCKKTKVAILGAGVAGIAAAQNLTQAKITDFLIVEHNDYIGGRLRSQQFGRNAKTGKPYTIELGANWVEGIGSLETHENPIWKLAQKHGLKTTYADYDALKTFDHKGAKNWTDKIAELDEAFENASGESGEILLDNLQDLSARAGLRTGGWRPDKNDMYAQAADWWGWDFEAAWTPDESGLVFGVAGDNATFGYFSDISNLVIDQRGYNYFLKQEAKTFLKENDPRLLLKTTVEGVEYNKKGVKVTTKDGGCIEASYAICTFSLGVLQKDVIEFKPKLPHWKQSAIDQFAMGTYTKIFMQFNESFWDIDAQYQLYTDPIERGRYPLFQPLNGKGFLEGSNIIFATVTGEQAYQVERQQTRRLKHKSWRFCSPCTLIRRSTSLQHSLTLAGALNRMTLEKHQNLRSNVERLWFAGEANSAEFFGFVHGGYTEGREIGHRIGRIINGEAGDDEFDMERYEVLHGTTHRDEYNDENGWLFPYDVDGDN
ncbi:n1-acetylpolyamine oxidase [Fusarium circinatum]|uniref:N1-acetylpolyamine oxidase n=1 Tax=Fusarium circinatum TaxID=48490 RepID=A0A8H5SRU9_FUSCI|nr:n1-acetylpolyamine oxidase [Fusarium circinatum]